MTTAEPFIFPRTSKPGYFYVVIDRHYVGTYPSTEAAISARNAFFSQGSYMCLLGVKQRRGNGRFSVTARTQIIGSFDSRREAENAFIDALEAIRRGEEPKRYTHRSTNA